MQTFIQQRMAKAQNKGCIGIRPDRQPVSIKFVWHIGGQRRDIDEPDPGIIGSCGKALLHMPACTALIDLGIFQGQAAKTDK